jgi:hypothetical protein
MTTRTKFSDFLHIVVALIVCAIFIFPAATYAETGNVIIASDTSAQVGDSLAVTVKYSASSLGQVNGELRYDPHMLKYVSGGTSSDPDKGIVRFDKAVDGVSSVQFVVHFEAFAEGSDFFLVNTSALLDDKGADLGKPGASVKLTVSEPAENPPADEPAVAPDTPAADPSTDTPTTVDDPSNADDTPAAVDESPATDTETEKAPDTIWVFVGAIAATTVLLILAIAVARHRRKSE